MRGFFGGLAWVMVSLLLASISLIVTLLGWALFAAVVWVVWAFLSKGSLPFPP